MHEADAKNIVVINAEGHVVGRLASLVAKRLLTGEEVYVINVEKAIITGKPRRVVEKYLRRVREWRTHYNPEKRGPKYPKRPDKLFKRIVRGMLPYKKPRGREALKRLKVFAGVPGELRGKDSIEIAEAKMRNIRVPYITLGELCAALGGKR